MVANRKMFWRLIFKALQLKRQRAMIIFAALTVGAAIVTAMSAVYFDINTKMRQELRTFGANYYVGANHQGLVKLKDVEKILQTAPKNLITDASPYLYGVARSEQEKIMLMGVWFHAMPTLAPYWQMEGNPIGVDFDDRNAMMGKSLADRLSLKVGDSITLAKGFKKHSFKIKAIIEAGDATDNMLVVSLEFAQKWLDKLGQVNYAQMNVQETANLSLKDFTAQLNRDYPELKSQPILKVSASEGQILDKIKGLMGLISVVILVLATLCVNTTLIAIVGERSKEFALQKALGAKKSDIVKQIVTEIFIIACGAMLAGLFLGYLLAQVLGLTVFNALIDLRLPVFPITMLLSLLVAVISVIIPTQRALNIEMANVLKGE